jgi:histidine ammonia-lyase
MATIAARKLRTVLRNVQSVLAIELIVAAQAVDWRVAMEIDPRKGRPAGKDWKEAERESEAFAERTRPERREEIAAHLGEGTRRLYLRVRELVPPMLGDRTLDGDIRAVKREIEAGFLYNEVHDGSGTTA